MLISSNAGRRRSKTWPPAIEGARKEGLERSPKSLHELPLGYNGRESLRLLSDRIIALSILARIGENGQEEPWYFFGSEGWGFKSLRARHEIDDLAKKT